MKNTGRWLQSPPFLLIAAAAALAFAYYSWLARATGTPFHWQHDLNGYYNLLGRAFAQGQLHLPLDAPEELLALNDPWDPALNQGWRLQDAVLFNGRYYLYHGAGPALVLFAPWRIVTGHDLPENFALVLMSVTTFLFLAGTLRSLLRRLSVAPGTGLLGLMLLVLIAGTGVPYLLVRVSVYEIALGGALLGSAGGWFCLIRSEASERAGWWLGAAGVLFGFAMSSRPHVGIAAAAASLTLLALRRQVRHLLVLAVPVVLTGAAILAYNHARFGNVLEFGTHYQLTDQRNQQRLNPSLDNIYPGLYYMLLCPPHVGPAFPFVRLHSRIPPITQSLPSDYFFEPVAGALPIAPVLVLLVFLPFVRAGATLVAMAAAAFGALLFVATLGLTTQRYQIDFVPLLLVVSLACGGALLARLRGRGRRLALTLFAGACTWAVVANAGLGMSGPYDEILQRRPESWMRIATWFSPLEEHKPALDPQVAAAVRIRAESYGPGLREPLIAFGHGAYRWMLYLHHTERGAFLTSFSDSNTAQASSPFLTGRTATLRAAYDPGPRTITVSVDGQPVIEHRIDHLAMARSQVQFGRNTTIPFLTYLEFTGTLEVLEYRYDDTRAR